MKKYLVIFLTISLSIYYIKTIIYNNDSIEIDKKIENISQTKQNFKPKEHKLLTNNFTLYSKSDFNKQNISNSPKLKTQNEYNKKYTQNKISPNTSTYIETNNYKEDIATIDTDSNKQIEFKAKNSTNSIKKEIKFQSNKTNKNLQKIATKIDTKKLIPKATTKKIDSDENGTISSFVVNDNPQNNTLVYKKDINPISKKQPQKARTNSNTDIADNNISKNILILDNDVYDPDYIPLVLNSIHEHKNKLVDLKLIIITEDGISNKTNMLYKSIIDKFNSNIPITLAHNVSDRAFESKLTKNLENFTEIIEDDQIQDAIEDLETKLEAQDDKSVSYATGGKLIFLSKFLSDPARLELFKLKVKEIVFGLGCNPKDKNCQNDFNLAATNKAYNATKDIYNKLHNKIPFVVIDDKRGKVRSLDIFKDANIPLMHHLLGTNIYGTYGDHNAGDVEVLFAKSREDSFEKNKCNITLKNRAFKAQSIGSSGNDFILTNKNLDFNNLTYNIYKSLIDTTK